MNTKDYNQDLGGGYYQSESDKDFDRWCQRQAEDATAEHMKSLQTEVDRLRAALREIAGRLDGHCCQIYSHIEVGSALAIARAALETKGGDDD